MVRFFTEIAPLVLVPTSILVICCCCENAPQPKATHAVYLCLWFQWERVYNGRGYMKIGIQSRKLRERIFNCNHEAHGHKVRLQTPKDCPQWHIFSTKSPFPRTSITSLNITANWRTSFQTSEPMDDISHSNNMQTYRQRNITQLLRLSHVQFQCIKNESHWSAMDSPYLIPQC